MNKLSYGGFNIVGGDINTAKEFLMAENGINGWYYASFADYRGKNFAVKECGSCRFLEKKSGNISSFGDYKYKCSAPTGCAASQMGQGKMVSECDSFEPLEKESNKKSGKSKRPIWLRIICCPLCCIWHTLGVPLNFERGCKKACSW
jgi:hypothetical protein